MGEICDIFNKMQTYTSLIYIVLLSAFLGYYVMKQNRRNKQNVVFSLLCFGIAMWVLGIDLLQQTHSFYWSDKLSLVGALLMVGSFYIFSKIFPTDSSVRLDWQEPWKNNAYYRLIPLVLLLLILPFNLIIRDVTWKDDNFGPMNGTLYPVFAIVCIGYVAATLYGFALQYKNNIGYKRQRMLYVALSLIFFIVVGLICDVILPALGVVAWKFIGPLSASVFLVLSAFALVSYNLLDLRVVLRSVLVNALSLIVAIVSMVQFYNYIRNHSVNRSQALTILVFCTILLFLFVRVLLGWIYTKLFLKGYIVFQDSFSELNIFLHEELNPLRIIFTANKYLKKGLRLEWVYYIDVRHQKYYFTPNPDAVLEGRVTTEQIFDDELNAYARTQHAPKFFYGAEFKAYPKISSAPIAILPLWNNGEMQGYFVLGPQRSVNGLSYEEGQRLQYAWAHMETAFDRALIYENLEQKVNAQVEDITYKDKKLKELVQNRLDFIQVTSHQLRTPVTSLSGALQLLLSGNFDRVEEKEMINLAYKKSKELSTTISSILKIARLEKDDEKDTSGFVNLNELFAALLPVVEAAARAKDIYIQYDPIARAEVFGNKLYLEQAFFNIIENGIQHTEEGGVRIYFKEDKDYITTIIEDTGTGIPKEIQPKIFSKNAISAKEGSTGLGLYIAKTIIDAHPEAKIYFETDSAGTKFYVSLKRFAIINA